MISVVRGRTLGTGYAACLWLRTGIRVEVVLAAAQLPTNREAGDTVRTRLEWPSEKVTNTAMHCVVFTLIHFNGLVLTPASVLMLFCEHVQTVLMYM